MRLSNVEYLIPAAFTAIDAHLASHYSKIPKGYQGAASGFGMTLKQMGLLPTLAVYSAKEDQAGIDRNRMLEVLLTIVQNDSHLETEFKQHLTSVNAGSLLQKVVQRDDHWRKIFVRHLLKAAVAFKLAIRTYELEK